MRNYYSMIYIAYLADSYKGHDPILAVSDQKYQIKYYLQEIRKLPKAKYYIREVTMDKDTAWSLYGDFMLEEFNQDYMYLTNRDIEYLDAEIENEILDWQELYEALKHYRALVNGTRKLQTYPFDQALQHLEAHLSRVKSLRILSDEVIKRSIVLSGNIIEYLSAMGSIEEDRELIETFYRKVNDED